ncbi:MAG TPA: hypothetical protein VFV10_11235 [Gammaproteobacteria bacterium]|nr:hypothetical protein [Gammaproteobacteria bacterium]
MRSPFSSRSSVGPVRNSNRLRLARPAALGLASLLAACSGGDGSGASSLPPKNDDPSPSVTIQGTVTFDLVPASVGGTGVALDYAEAMESPARGVTVEAVSNATSVVLASTTTDAAGHYALSVAANTEVLVRARAELIRAASPSWDVRVVDNTSADALYVLDGTASSTGMADETRNLHAASGWDGASYSGERSAAPFAILDVIYDAMQFVQGAAPATSPVTSFPPLVVHWSAKNSLNSGPSGGPDPATGAIGTSFFNASGIYLLGTADSDTDEYDRHVIAHEWGHYFENSFARSDSIGGPHSRGDQLDMRAAFSEGLGNALSAILTGDSLYTDTLGAGQSRGFAFDVEKPLSATGATTNPGWFSEESIQQIIYDLYDSTQDKREDSLALGFAPLFDALANHLKLSPALTSLFPFIEGVETLLPEDKPQIDALVGTEAIDPIGDDYGDGQTNGGYLDGIPQTAPDAEVLPIYGDIAPGGPSVKVCSTDDFAGATGSVNKLGSRAFLRFSVATPAMYGITATTTEMPGGATADPDMVLHQRGTVVKSWGPPDPSACTTSNPAGCRESFSRLLAAGDYVLEVYEWTNTQDRDADRPPIGRTCFNVAITPQ